MKRVILLLTIFAAYAFGFNYNGTWINRSDSSYNDPIKLEIEGTRVRPSIQRGAKVFTLKSKQATQLQSGLYEAWGFGPKNLVLYIRPINSNKIKVVEKKIYTNKKKVYTKSFIFTKNRPIQSIRKRYIGKFRSTSRFSALSRVVIRDVDGKLFVRAWRKTRNGIKPLGVARAKLYGNKLHISWNRRGLVVNATIRGYNYNSSNNRFRNLELNLKATNLNSGLTNRQTIQLKRGVTPMPKREIYSRPINKPMPKPIYTAPNPRLIHKRVKIGPVDVNLMINGY